jgi:hypothetical protein
LHAWRRLPFEPRGLHRAALASLAFAAILTVVAFAFVGARGEFSTMPKQSARGLTFDQCPDQLKHREADLADVRQDLHRANTRRETLEAELELPLKDGSTVPGYRLDSLRPALEQEKSEIRSLESKKRALDGDPAGAQVIFYLAGYSS